MAVSTRKWRVPAIKDRQPQRTHKRLAVALTPPSNTPRSLLDGGGGGGSGGTTGGYAEVQGRQHDRPNTEG